MKKLRKNEDLYFYKGKIYTELGLKRALIKSDEVWTNTGVFYLYAKTEEYYWKYSQLKERLRDREIITEDEYKHFRKWLNEQIREGYASFTRKMTFYHCHQNDGVGTDWHDCLETLREFGDSEDNRIKTDEDIIDDYCETLDDDQFAIFSKLPDQRQFNIASKWAIQEYYKKEKENCIPY